MWNLEIQCLEREVVSRRFLHCPTEKGPRLLLEVAQSITHRYEKCDSPSVPNPGCLMLDTPELTRLSQ